MRRFLLATGTALLAVSLLMTGTPAKAGELSWTDPAGDATPAGVPAPPLSEPSYDVVKSTISSDGTTLVWVAQVPGLTAEPPPRAPGMHFTFSFRFGDKGYRWVVAKDRLGGGGTKFLVSGTGASSQVDCGKCIGKMDVGAKRVTITAPIASMDRGIEGKFGPGSVLEAVSVGAGRYYEVPGVVSYFPVDETAPAPAPGTFPV